MKKILIFIMFLSGCNVLKMITNQNTSLDDDFFSSADRSGSSGSTDTDMPIFALGYSEAYRDFYTYEDTMFRTLYLWGYDFEGIDKIECSNDNGQTWTDCTGQTEFTWNWEDYNATHFFRATYKNSEYTEQFTPAEAYPNITFGACDHRISTGGTIAETFGALLNITDGDVICIDDGVVIYNDGTDAEIGFAVPNIKVVANSGNYVLLRNNLRPGTAVFDNYARENIDLYGLQIESNVDSNYAVILDGNNSDLWECQIYSSGLNALGALKIEYGSHQISMSSIFNESITSGSALYVNNADVTIKNYSYIAGGYQAVYLWNNDSMAHNFDIYNSHIEGRNISYATVGDGVITTYLNGSDYIINFVDSYLYSRGGPVLAIDDAGNNLSVNLENTIIQRESDNNLSSSAIYSTETTGAVSVNADSVTYFCNMVSDAGAMFDTIYSGTNITFDVTTMSNHTTNDHVPLCSDVIPIGTEIIP